MELFLQFGHGMIQHCVHLLKSWEGGTVVLSPRDTSEQRIVKLAEQLVAIPGGSVLFDPQFYVPRSDHEQLCSYSYWPNDYATGGFFNSESLRRLVDEIIKFNAELGTAAIILPGILAEEVNDDWVAVQSSVIEAGLSLGLSTPVYPTIALGDQVMANANQVSVLLEAAEKWNAPGYYVVCQHPRGSYLVANPMWVANVLDLVAGLRLNGAKVVLGYCSHQLLVAACSKVNAICSGTFMNVRSFPPEKFKKSVDEPKQRSTWYYCPQAYSEYKDTYLDIAHRLGVLELLEAPIEYGGYANRLFSGTQPTTVGFSEQDAFRHYLHSLHSQVASAVKATFDETIGAYQRSLSVADHLLRSMHDSGITGQNRDFLEIVEANRAALSAHSATRGPILRRRWDSLI